MAEAKCNKKHIIEIPDEEWKCPHCGSEDFWAEPEFEGDTAFDCDRVHDKDLLICGKCDAVISAKSFEKKYVKLKNLVKCPQCKGSGFVKGESDNKAG